MKHKEVICAISISLTIGILAGILYYLYFLQFIPMSNLKSGLTLVYLVIFFSCLVYFVIYKYVLPKLCTYLPLHRIFWIIGSLLAGIWLAFAIPLPIPMFFPSPHTLEIIATGQKNALSQGSEVWISGLFTPDGNQVPVTDFSLVGDWEIRDGVPLSYKNQPAQLYWKGKPSGSLKLVLLSHPWSGKVNIIWDGREELVDLYSSTGDKKEMLLEVKAPNKPWYFYTLFYLGGGILLGLVLLLITLLIVPRIPRSNQYLSTSKWGWIYYASLLLLIWTIYLLAFWPGLMSSDSFDQWSQLLNLKLNDWHPAFHTLTNWVVTRIYLSPATVALFQIIFLAILTGYILYAFEKMGVSKIITWSICSFFAIIPTNGLMVITLWKDIPYSISILLLTFLMYKIVASNGKWFDSKINIILLSITLVLVSLYRHNGFPVVFGSILLLGFVYSRNIKNLCAVVISSALIIFIIKGPIYQLIKVAPSPEAQSMLILLFPIGEHLVENTPLDTNEKHILSNLRPIQDDWTYSCYRIDSVLFGGPFNVDNFYKNYKAIPNIILDLSKKNPLATLRHFYCTSSYIWRITYPQNSHFINTAPIYPSKGMIYDITRGSISDLIMSKRNSVDNTKYLIFTSKTPVLSAVLRYFYNKTLLPYLYWFFWRPAFHLYLFILCLLIFSIRINNYKYLLVGCPILFQSLTLFFINISHEFRFQYSVFLASTLLSILFLMIPTKNDSIHAHGAVNE
jgi:hypothetical protein